MGYQSELQATPLYIVRKYQNMPEEKINEMDNFLFWLTHDYSNDDLSEEEENELKLLLKDIIQEYLDIDIEKIKNSELMLLEKWKRVSS